MSRFSDIKNSPDKVQLSRLSHVTFEHPDLKKFEEFAADFGFVEAHRSEDTIFFRGYGRDPYVYVARQSKDGLPHFRGAAFVAKSEQDFNKAAALPGAVVSSLESAPGGGRQVSFNRIDDTSFHVVYGQQDREPDSAQTNAVHESQGPPNLPFEKPRKNQFQRLLAGPSPIHKLGHFGLVLRDFDDELAWYTSTFNFKPSDILYHPDHPDVDVITFMHLDLGQEFSDHHSFFIHRALPGVNKSFMHHTSYEVADFDTQMLGHWHLAGKGWKATWGVGRHILGSQIFDYWDDPSGHHIEHYCDGDVVNEDVQTKRDTLGPLSIWGPELPKDFLEDGTQVSYL